MRPWPRRIGALLGRPLTPFVAAAALVAAAAAAPSLVPTERPYVLHQGQRYPPEAAGSFYSCHEIAHPQIRCFDSTERMKGDILANFPAKRRAAEELMPDVTPTFEGP